MRLLNVRARRHDRLKLSVGWPWDQLGLGVALVLVGLGLMWPALATDFVAFLSRLILGGVVACGGMLMLYFAAEVMSEAVVFDRRTGDFLTIALARGRRRVTRRPIHMLRQVTVRPNGLAPGGYGLVFEFRGEPAITFPLDANAQDPGEGEAIVRQVWAFIQRKGAAG